MRTFKTLLAVLLCAAPACTDNPSKITGRWSVGRGAGGCDDALFESDDIRVTVTQRTQFTGPTATNYDELVAANTYSCGEKTFTLDVDQVIAPEQSVDATVELLGYSDGEVISTVAFTGLDLFTKDSADLGAITFR